MTSSLDADVADRLALRALVDEYALAVDDRDAERFAGIFTAAGVLAVYEPGEAEPSLSYRGPDELRRVMNLLRPFSATFHLVANHVCRVDGNRAEGDTYCLAHHLTENAETSPTDTVMLIRYRDEYERADGGWRFARRDVLRQWTDYHEAARARLAG
jgi:hypothetical protein